MTDLELEKARKDYRMGLEGQRKLLECVANKAVSIFTDQYFPNVNEEKISSISKDEILRAAFLANFQDTEASSNLLVYLNRIQRIDNYISDGRPELKSVIWEKEGKTVYPKGIHLFGFYVDLETNQPSLINQEMQECLDTSYFLSLPDYTPQTETYHYNSKSQEKITKGKATDAFNRLQLYYFKQIYETDYEQAVLHMQLLSDDQLRKICLTK